MNRGEGLIFNEFSPDLGLTLGGRWRRWLDGRTRPVTVRLTVRRQKVLQDADLEVENMFHRLL